MTTGENFIAIMVLQAVFNLLACYLLYSLNRTVEKLHRISNTKRVRPGETFDISPGESVVIELPLPLPSAHNDVDTRRVWL